MTNAFDLSDVRQSWSFTIPMAIPSGNVLRRAYRNPHVYKRLRDDLELLVKGCAQWVPKATGPRKVTITRLIGKNGKLYDHDNLVGGAKAHLDAMVRAKLLLGDAPHQVVVTYEQERSGGHGTRVEIEEVQP